MRIAFLIVLSLSLGACASNRNPYYDAAKPHHRPTGFANTDAKTSGGRSSFFRQIVRHIRGDFRPLKEPVGGYAKFASDWTTAVDLAGLTNAKEASVTWLGHATVLLQIDGVNVLTDPQFSEHAGPLSRFGAKRRVPIPLAVEQLPRIDLVLVSHNHYDHLDYETVNRLLAAQGDNPRWLVPLGIKAWLNDRGVRNVREMDWWDNEEVKGLRVHFTPAQHWSKRTPWDTNASLWGGFAVERLTSSQAPIWRFLYTGDTGYSADFAEIRRRIGPVDLLAVPVGAYEPRDFMARQHVNPDDAIRIALDVEAKQSLGVHWGTFELTQESFDQPPKDLAIALQKRGIAPERFWMFRHGERRALAVPPAR